MKCVVAILAGGLATRLRPLTTEIPKALIPVCGKPFIDYQFSLLEGMGFTDVVVCTGYKGTMIEDHVRTLKPRLHVKFSHDGDVLLGTGGALMKALPDLGERFLVIYGDSYLEGDYPAIVKHFDAARTNPTPLGLMTVFRNSGQFDKSNVLFRGGAIESYNKRSPSADMDYIDWGLGILHRRAFEPFASQSVFDLALVYEDLVSRRQLLGFEVTNRFFEIGSIQGIEDLESHLKKKSPNVTF